MQKTPTLFLSAISAFYLCGCSFSTASAQLPPKQLHEHMPLTVVDGLKEAISTSYVDVEKATMMLDHLDKIDNNQQIQMKEDPETFAEFLTKELQQVSGDQHIRIQYSPIALDIPDSEQVSRDFEDSMEMKFWKSRNLGFEKVERLPFNVGYLKLSAFAPVEQAKAKLAASFEFLKDTDSFILDLRGNFGGYEYTDQLIASYFLKEKTHLLDMHSRKTGEIEERWSDSQLNGPRYGTDRPVYILIDENTFSAGESLSYMMKHIDRATIVGTKSIGAANAGSDIQITQHFSAFIPTRRPVYTSTNSNFEGKGVVPHIEAPSSSALNIAQTHYLDILKTTTNDARKLKRIEARISKLVEDNKIE
ncbi:S41 family peptidase [Hirschia maritima]|uniref:S41 family peptidase n=1 Tax=Hirschia maritima TaxID=1121961 RepID=UPI0003704B73|nr:S41 family peptidase [Hirschia maritima]